MGKRKQRTRTSERKSKINDLPECILGGILSSLPMETVCRCRLVCKSWYKLITSNPSFPERSLATEPSYSSVIAHIHGLTCALLKFPSQSQTDLQAVRLSRPENTFRIGEAGRLKLVGSSNGLLCFVNRFSDINNGVYLANPLLGECVNLPKPRRDAKICEMAYAFVFCESIVQYKVLRVVHRRFITRPNTSKAEVLTIGIDRKWRDIGKVPFPIHGCICSVVLGGSLHRIVESSPRRGYVCKFDVKEEKYRSIAIPRKVQLSSKQSQWKDLGLGVFEGRLFLMDNTTYNEVLIWLQDYPDAGSWTQHLPIQSKHSRVYEMSEDSGFVSNKHLMSLDPAKDPFTSVLGIYAYSCLPETFMHAPSLLSPKAIMKGGH